MNEDPQSFLPPFSFFPVIGFTFVLLLSIVFLPAISIASDSGVVPINRVVGSTFRDCPDCPQITVVPAGDFLMGLSKEDKERDLIQVPPKYRTSLIPFLSMGVQDIMEQEMPQHPVHIDYSFGLGTYLITRSEFAAFVQKTGYDANGTCTSYDRLMSRKVRGLTWQHPVFIQTDRDPVVCVSKRDAEAYIAWLNTKVHGPSAKGGALYRLPSEAEWEYAARAGTKTAYWWGDSIGQNNAVCDVCGTHWDNKQTAPVGSFQANPFGLYDMNGNVWELTADCWSEGYSADAPSDGSPFVAANCSYYTMRGGSWGSDPWNLRSTGRGRASPEDRGNDIGFRVAREINQ